MSIFEEVEIHIKKDSDPLFDQLDIEQAYFENGKVYVSETLWKRIKPMLDELKKGKEDGKL